MPGWFAVVMGWCGRALAWHRAGSPLGEAAGWVAAAAGAVALLAFVLLLLARLAQAGPLPERLLPSWFIGVAPPSVIGLSALALGAPAALAWMAWGVAVFFLLWALPLAPRAWRLPSAVPHWATSFPAAAFATLTIRLATLPGGAWQQVPATAVLALTTLLILVLSAATLAGLVRGTMLVPEPVPAKWRAARSCVFRRSPDAAGPLRSVRRKRPAAGLGTA